MQDIVEDEGGEDFVGVEWEGAEREGVGEGDGGFCEEGRGGERVTHCEVVWVEGPRGSCGDLLVVL